MEESLRRGGGRVVQGGPALGWISGGKRGEGRRGGGLMLGSLVREGWWFCLGDGREATSLVVLEVGVGTEASLRAAASPSLDWGGEFG